VSPVVLPRPLPRADLVWLVVLGGPALLDYWYDRGEPDADTLSERIRDWFQVDTPLGKVAFTVTLAAGAHWLHRHILKPL
jgi:hypothetical protein